jgi:hypothetical protein
VTKRKECLYVTLYYTKKGLRFSCLVYIIIINIIIIYRKQMPRLGTDKHTCDVCGRVCPSRQAKWSHKRFCKSNVNSTTISSTTGQHTIESSVISQMQLQIDALQQQLASLASSNKTTTINNITTTTTTSNSNNNTITTNNTNHIHINMFRHEDTSYITDDMLKSFNTSDDDLTKKLVELVVLTHFNKEHPENMNAYVPHGSADGKVLGKKGWESIPLQTMAELIAYSAGHRMWSHVEDNEVQYKKR